MTDEENKSDKISTDKQSNEARFDVTSLNDVKDEQGNGIFHIKTKTKWIILISTLILLIVALLIYAKFEAGLDAEMWQVAVWALCGVLSLYAMFARSLAALLLNIVLFFGVSLIPAWQMGYDFFRPVIEKLTGIK